MALIGLLVVVVFIGLIFISWLTQGPAADDHNREGQDDLYKKALIYAVILLFVLGLIASIIS